MFDFQNQNHKNTSVVIRSPILKKLGLILAIGASLLLPVNPVDAKTSRIKDIVNIEGVRENQLVGYGLIVGLNGTGDGLNNSPFTKQSLIAMLCVVLVLRPLL